MKNSEDQQFLFLDFFEGRNGKPISKTKEGKICLLNFNNCKKNRVYVHAGEQWKCAVDREEEKKIIVTPLYITLDAKENEYLVAEKAKMLKGRFNRDREK